MRTQGPKSERATVIVYIKSQDNKNTSWKANGNVFSDGDKRLLFERDAIIADPVGIVPRRGPLEHPTVPLHCAVDGTAKQYQLQRYDKSCAESVLGRQDHQAIKTLSHLASIQSNFVSLIL